MCKQWQILLLGLLCSGILAGQTAFVPPGFEGPIYFAESGQMLPSSEGAALYRVYRLVNSPKSPQRSNRPSVSTKSAERNEYFYFEDYYLSGEIEAQGNMWVSKVHREQGAGLNSLRVHLKGMCKWYHKNGQLSQQGIYNGADWYGEQKFYDSAGRLIKSEPGKALSSYDYGFERNILNRPEFSYTNPDNNDILPTPASLMAEETEEVKVAPTDLAAKMNTIPRFKIKAYRSYLGEYLGKTTNASLKKVANTSLDLVEVNVRKGEAVLEIHWYGGFSAYAKLQASINDNVLFARGDWMVKGEKAGIITLATFLTEKEGHLEGFFNIKLKGEDKTQSCSFTLAKEIHKSDY